MNLPIGIEVSHSKQQVFATLNEDYPTRGLKYKWEYQTSVTALNEDLKIIEFGGFILSDNKWVERPIDHRPFTIQEFSDWYHCPGGILQKGIKATDNENWTTSNTVETIDSRVLWYFIGINKKEEKYVGYAEIEMIKKLE